MFNAIENFGIFKYKSFGEFFVPFNKKKECVHVLEFINCFGETFDVMVFVGVLVLV